MGRDSGSLAIWPFTGVECNLPGHLRYLLPGALATSGAGMVAENAENRKAEKYWGLQASHSFTRIAVETMGAIGPRSMTSSRS